MPRDLWSQEFYDQKNFERIRNATPQEFLPYEEARERYIEKKIKPLHDTYRQYDHDAFKDFSRRRGMAIHSSDLIFRIEKLNPHLQIQQQYNFKDDWGLYSSAVGHVQFITGFPKGWLTEFSYSLVDEKDLPTEERRGWRTVLVYCLLKGALTWEQITGEFGEPQDGLNEARWMDATMEFRRGGDQVFLRNISNAVG